MGRALILGVAITALSTGACTGKSPFGGNGGGGDRPDAGPNPDVSVIGDGQTTDSGEPCSFGSDCDSGLCIPSGTAVGAPKTCAGVCVGAVTSSAVCAGDNGTCFPGWSHWSLSGSPPLFCLCNPFGETQDACNGQDNDCDGLLDEDGDYLCEAADPYQRCESSQCIDCPARCSGTCTDLSTDLTNCGGCGTSCGGVTATTEPSCSVTGCQTLDIIAPTRGRLHHPVVDATSVYFVDGDAFKIKKCPLAGCTVAPEEVTTSIGYPNTVAVDATSIYWSAEQLLQSCPITGCGGTPTTIAQVAQGYFKGFLLRGADMIIVDAGNTTGTGRIISCPITGCPASPTTLASGLRFPDRIATDGTDLFFIRDNDVAGPDQVLRCSLAGCGTTPTVVATMPYVDSPIVVAQGKVYFIASVSNGPRQILACPTTGCTGAPEVITTLTSYLGDLFVDGSTLYWTTTSRGGVLESCSLGGCTRPTALATNMPTISGVAQTPTAYYFTSDGQSPTYTDGKLRRMAR